MNVNLDVGSVTGDTVLIREIAIDKPQVTYEIGGDGSNIDALRRNIDSYLEKKGLKGGKSDGDAKKDKDGKKLIIENLYIRGGTVSVSATILKGRKVTSPLPDIHLKDIGKKEGGASPGEVVDKVMKQVSDSATKSVSSLNIEGLLGGAGEIAKDATKMVGEGVKGVTEKLGEGGGDAGKMIEEGAGDVGKALKGLFGK